MGARLAISSCFLVGFAVGFWACGGDDDTEGAGCTNTCRFASDSDCDDGGPGSDFDLCDLGTDCDDCGPRGGGGGIIDPPEPTLRPCFYTYRSRFACPGLPNSFDGPEERCSMVESLEECRERFESDVSCSGSCCSDTTYSGHTLGTGSCN